MPASSWLGQSLPLHSKSSVFSPSTAAAAATTDMAEGSDTSDINTLRQTLIRDIYTNLKFPLTGHPEGRALLWLADMDVLYDLRASTQDFDGIFHSGFDCITFTTQTAGTCILFINSLSLLLTN